MTRTVLGLLVLFSCSCTSKPVDAINSLIGTATHKIRSFWYKGLSERLKPENEALVRNIQQKMGITQDIHVYKLTQSLNYAGPHNLYNCIYLDEKEFEWARKNDDYSALVFTIGHELMHAEYYHGLKFAGIWCTAAIIAEKALKKPLSTIPKALQLIAGLPLSLFLGLNATKILGPVSCAFEYQADRECLKRLAPWYERDDLIRGCATALGSFDKNPSRLAAWFSTHPTTRDRLRALAMKKKESQHYGEQLIFLLKEYVGNLIRGRCFTEHEQDNELWKALLSTYDIRFAASMVSVDCRLAHEYSYLIKKLNVVPLFDDIIRYLTGQSDDDSSLEVMDDTEIYLNYLKGKTLNISRYEKARASLKRLEQQVYSILEDGICHYNY